MPVGSDDNNADIEMDFKCDKCDSNEGVISSQKETTTILKDNAKPILKFSVSAILGDKKECARVRHGKWVLLQHLKSNAQLNQANYLCEFDSLEIKRKRGVAKIWKFWGMFKN